MALRVFGIGSLFVHGLYLVVGDDEMGDGACSGYHALANKSFRYRRLGNILLKKRNIRKGLIHLQPIILDGEQKKTN